MPSPADEHAIRFCGPVNNIHEGPAIGNGDLAAIVQVFQNELRLNLGKNDVWDARFDNVAEDVVLKHDDLIGMSDGVVLPQQSAGWKNVPPCPKPAGRIRVIHSGFSSTAVDTVVDIARGVVEASYHIDFRYWGTGTLFIQAFVDRNANVVRLRTRTEGIVASYYVCVEKLPDSLDASVPAPEVRLDDEWHGTVTQRIPGEFDVAPFAWHLAGAFPSSGAGRKVTPVAARRFQICQLCEAEPGRTLEFAVGVATDRDGAGESRRRAVELAGDNSPDAYDEALGEHQKGWRAFWSASGIELEDKELEASWYRNLFTLACSIAPDAQAPGLCANVPTADRAPWHGVYTVNMNIQKMFLASLPTNHPEWLECYAGWLRQMMPTFRYMAKLIFDLDGIHSEHMILPFVPPRRAHVCNTAGRSLNMTGWHAQPLWWHWQFTRDRAFLAEHTYPYLKEAAQFYRRYIEKYMDESGDIYPSMNLEEPGWTPGFAHNRDCICDLIMFRHTFEWAIEASEILDLDPDLRERWREALARVRPVEYERLDTGRPWLPRARGERRSGRRQEIPYEGHSQIMWGAWCVFPGEHIDGDEEGGLAQAVRDLMLHMPEEVRHPDFNWVHLWWCAIPGLRLGLPDAFEHAREIILRERFPAGHAKTTHWIHLKPDSWRAPEDNYLGVAATTEMLLQSQGEVIRLFPAWPRDKRARFRNLPARGAFLVSASWEPESGLTARIHSRAGCVCRVRRREGTPPQVVCAGRPVETRIDGRDLVFSTRPGADYALAWRRE